MSESHARLIVFERSGRWAAALRRELAGPGVRVWETRTLDDCWNELARSPASFLVFELAGNPDKLLDYLSRQPREYPLARIAVTAERTLADYRWLICEAGAVYFACSPRKMRTLARLVCRHLAETRPPQLEFTERIWTNLPWQ